MAGVSVRSSSQAQFPAQVHDAKAAIRWLRSNAGQYGLDPSRFAVMGDSSGGWVANMATLTGGVTSLEGSIGVTGVSSAVQAGVSFFGPTDFLQMNAQRPPGGGLDHDGPGSPESMLIGCAIQTCPDRVQEANPIRYVDANDPPMMLLHGQADNIVPHGQSALLHDALKAACVDTRFFSVPGAGHGTSDVLSSSRYGTQTVRTVSDCRETVTVGSPNPSWSEVANFLDTALDVEGGTPDPDPDPDPGLCEVTYTANTWNTGFTASVSITNTGTTPLNGWALEWTWPGNQRVTSAWNATVAQTGSQVTARNAPYNGTIPPGTRAEFGFQATYSGTNDAPAQFSLNGTDCAAA
ncbi:cellulose binding domain-containing protein [Streptomyces litchfieldiae]|uniref:Cellulose binding domain-containing protein n=1 Tax=Streptomyces litchfieldiae TaxID=3075543 RepID=A0ABU2MKS1_9ACTN|nr:cellulose binding domain-containing protein [Streptomyces sp. DSM 44938]MDT0341259.1 cellulose binding domain-containing protein [Streptomyces sp. DSM 44938]